MVEEQNICVGLGCVIEPKVFTSHRDFLKHNLPHCQIVEFGDILKKQIPPTIVDELLQRNLEELLAEAEVYIDQISQAFKTFLILIRQTTHNLITRNFLEIRRLQLIFHSTELKTVESLQGLQGDLRCLSDASKVRAGIEISEKTQAEIILQLYEIKQKLTNISTIHCGSSAQNLPPQEQQILIQQKAQNEQPVSQQSIQVLQIEPKRLQQANIQSNQQFSQWEANIEQNMQEKVNSFAQYITVSFKQNRTLELKSKKGFITLNTISELISLCIKLEPLNLEITLNNKKLTNIKPISELKSLVNLTSLSINLMENQVVDIKPISELKSLLNLTSLTINLMLNQVVDIQPISELKSLLSLTSLTIYLGQNQVVDIKPISELKSLLNLNSLTIDLQGNQVLDIIPISELKSLLNLTSLDIDLTSNKIPISSTWTINDLSDFDRFI